jgi:2-polyprenyl-3-methyl-5-hydroxy-6-metoxy-1,4-benzoquinol methylase
VQYLTDTASEWDVNAEARHKQIISNVDVSYHKILIPTILRLVGDISNKRVIDVGCGTGYLAAKIAPQASFVLGLDPSKGMIEVANREYGHIPRLKFVNESIESFSGNRKNIMFDTAISNMSLITIPNLDEALKAVSLVLIPRGIFAINITHPCYYNQHRKYQSQEDFQYIVSHAQKGQFIISEDAKGLPSPTTHYHRPLQEYFRSLREASFTIDQLIEPFPNQSIQKLYTIPWKIPHFLSIRCFKTDSAN